MAVNIKGGWHHHGPLTLTETLHGELHVSIEQWPIPKGTKAPRPPRREIKIGEQTIRKILALIAEDMRI